MGAPCGKIFLSFRGRVSMTLPQMPSVPDNGEQQFRGIPVSPGISRGKIHVLGKDNLTVEKRAVAEHEVPAEIKRLEAALLETRKHVQELQKNIRLGMGAEHAGIFDAHLLVLEDPTLLEEVRRRIEEDRINVEYAFQAVADRYSASLAAAQDAYLSERVTDIQDVAGRVLGRLMGRGESDPLSALTEPCIVVAHDLAPSQTAHLDRRKVLGFATDVGSKTSHTAIMARSLQIPAVVGLGNLSARIPPGVDALLDGYSGLVIINPSDQTLFEYGELATRQKKLERRLDEVAEQPAQTKDGHHVILSGNIEEPGDTEAVIDNGAEGVGLFRTEYIFLDRETIPSEEEQYESYRKVAAALKPAPVVIRTLDLGGDKFRSNLRMPKEMNPFLGWRAIRYCLHEQDVFKTQLRAILRASTEGNVKMMYPMISGLNELTQANDLVEKCRQELRGEGIAFDETMEIGAMIETPSAALVAESLGRRLKFFSIGTNDLIQYSLAVDRTNEKIAHLYEPTHPAILQLIKATVDAARKNGIWVGVCGEMAGDYILLPLLLGLGVDELSVAPPVVPRLKYVMQRLEMKDCRELARYALEEESGHAILDQCLEVTRKAAPELFLNPEGVAE